MATALATFGPVFWLPPFAGDNLYALAWVHSAPPTALLGVDPAIYPEWRPLPYAVLWLTYRIAGLDAVPVYFFVNMAVWTFCAWLVYRVVVTLTDSPFAACVAALLLLVDGRTVAAMTWIIESQMLLACAFGLLALWMVVEMGERRGDWRHGVAIALLLLVSALSKEYGLAVALAIGVHGFWTGRRTLTAAALVALLSYASLRMMLSDGGGGVFCDDMGFFFSMTTRCLDPLSAGGLPQMAYNVAAGTLGTMIPHLFDDEGMIAIDYSGAALSSTVLLAAVVGAVRGPRVVRMFLFLVVTTGLLSFLLYRTRNQLIGAAGIAICCGVGLSLLLRAGERRVPALSAIVAPLVAVAFLGWNAYHLRLQIAAVVAEVQSSDPCAAAVRHRDFGSRFIPLVKRAYRLPDSECTGAG